MRRRFVIGYQQVETSPMRQFRCAATGVWDKRRMPVMRTRADELDPEGGEGYYWCAADKPETSDTTSGLWLRRIYNTSKVPELARCEACGERLADLQRTLTAAFNLAAVLGQKDPLT
jgi:hypothetical protein